MAPFGYGLWVWLKANPVVAWIAGAGVAIATFLSWQRLRDIRIRKQERAKIEIKVQKENRRVEEAVDEADRDAVERLNSEQLRKLTERDPLNRGRAPRD